MGSDQYLRGAPVKGVTFNQVNVVKVLHSVWYYVPLV